MRAFPEQVASPEYALQVQVRTMGSSGQISFAGRRLRCPKAVIDRRVALRATDVDDVLLSGLNI
ncbi:hypothetical protein [Xanthobacter sediminis]